MPKNQTRKQYTDAEKAAYYKKKLAGASRAQAPRKSYKKKTRRTSTQKRMLETAPWWTTPLPLIGGAVGNYIAPGIGGAIGSAAGGLVASIAGHGAYTVSRNNLIYPDQTPIFETKSNGCVNICHREFITDVITNSNTGATGGFQVQSYPIDVANPTTFPYLSQIAANFEEWHMNGLIFEFKTTSGSISSTGQLGTAILATQYNSNALPFTSKQAMEAYTFASSTVVSASVIHPVECDPSQTPSGGLFYTNVPGISSDNNDKRWSQLGNFNIATQGCALNENVGELWVSYDVWLCKPRLIQGESNLYDHYQLFTGIATGAGAGPYFGTSPSYTDDSDRFTALGGNTIYFSSSFNGNVLIYYVVQGSAGLWLGPNMSQGVGCQTLKTIVGNTDNFEPMNTAAALPYVYEVGTFELTSQPSGSGLPSGYGSSVLFGVGTNGTFFTPTSGDLFIIQLPSSVVGG